MTRTTATLHEALGLRPSHHRRLYRAAAPGGAGDSHPAETGDTHSGLAAWGSQTDAQARLITATPGMFTGESPGSPRSRNVTLCSQVQSDKTERPFDLPTEPHVTLRRVHTVPDFSLTADPYKLPHQWALSKRPAPCMGPGHAWTPIAPAAPA